MSNTQPINVCVVRYEQDGRVLHATSSSVESKDHAIEQALQGLEKVQRDNNIVFKLLELYSEWEPSPALRDKIFADYHGIKVTFSFTDGQEKEHKAAIDKFLKKKWWQFWK